MKQISILIIDDEEKFASMLSKRIELRGCQSKVCYTATTGLQWIKQHSHLITLILLDLQLPDLYGTEVLSRIKEIDPTLPVIILTGHGSEKDQKECMRLGAYQFKHKPLNIDDLMIILKEIQDKSE